MHRTRSAFIIIWSALSVIGMFISDPMSYIPFFLLGFHTPRDSIYFFVVYMVIAEHTYLATLSFVIFVVFIVLWIISLIRLKKGYLFERLFIADTILSMIRMSIAALALKDDFSAWGHLIGLIVVNILYICLYIFVFHYKRGNRIIKKR